MARLAFCDYHNMITILEKSEHNVDFHQIVDFVEASHTTYALTINPTVYVSHIRQFWSTARIETTNEGTKILATVDGKPRTISESSIRRNLKVNDKEGINTLPDAELFENLALVYNFSKMIFDGMVRNVNNKGSKFLMYLRVNNPSFSDWTVPLFDSMLVTQGEGSGTLTEPHYTPSLEAQQSSHHELTSPSHPTASTKSIPITTPTEILTLSQGEAFLTITGLEARQDRENIIKTSALPHDSTPRVTSLDADEDNLEISSLKARIKLLEDKDKGTAELPGDDAPIKGRSLEIGEEAGLERSIERGSNDTEELVNVLTSLDAVNILTSGVQAVSVPPVYEIPTIGVPTGSGMVPTVSDIVITASVVTPYSRRKGKEKMVESDTPKKKNLQEQIDVQMAREMEEQMAREDQRMDEQIARDAEIARIHAKEELEKIDLINKLVKYQDHHTKILKYQAQQSKPRSKKEQREFYMSVLKSHFGWKTKHFREEEERFKRKGLRLEQDSAKKVKTSEEGKRDYWKITGLRGNTTVYQFFVDMLKQFDREDLNQLWMSVKETLSIRQALSDQEKELWVKLKRDQEIFMLVERDYPLRRGLAIVMITNKLQVENYS
nr:hypothetical protein [Tanacetum cinerariifolium]